MGNKDWNTWFQELSSKMAQEAGARLAEAKQKAAERGKEPFSLERLEKFYLPVRYLLAKTTPEARAKALESEYYLQYGEVMTLEEFARALRRTEEFEGGDLGRE
jgi:predicted exporter